MEKYICPMHPEIRSDTPGSCPKCGMRLKLESEAMSQSHEHQDGSYVPLFIIIGLILGAVAAVGLKDYNAGSFSWADVMYNFMAGFFLVFAGFKLLDVKGFAEGYSTYDLLARKVFGYGYIYPFLELAFGLAYLTRFNLELTNYAVLAVMVFSGLGVLQSLLKHRSIRCVCLGTVIKVPLTTVTLIEDFGMAAMALIMILV
jgi:hypothetical protein